MILGDALCQLLIAGKIHTESSKFTQSNFLSHCKTCLGQTQELTGCARCAALLGPEKKPESRVEAGNCPPRDGQAGAASPNMTHSRLH